MIIKGTDRYASRLIFHEVFIHLESDLSEIYVLDDFLFLTGSLFGVIVQQTRISNVLHKEDPICSVTTILFRYYLSNLGNYFL